jgi:hypothetical protein
MLNTLEPHQDVFEQPPRRFQGRSKKQLKQLITHDGVCWVARWEGRKGKFFGATKNEAQKALQSGGQ